MEVCNLVDQRKLKSKQGGGKSRSRSIQIMEPQMLRSSQSLFPLKRECEGGAKRRNH
jgi:hypothetical protein